MRIFVIKSILFMIALFVTLDSSPDAVGGETRTQLQKGDRAAVGFTCRFPNGEVAASTGLIAEDAKITKSPIFRPRSKTEPLVLPVGGGEDIFGKAGERGFEGEIVAHISKALVGLKPGERRSLELEFKGVLSAKQDESLELEMARKRLRPKKMVMSIDRYNQYKSGNPPAVGDSLAFDPDFPGRVASVDDKEVTVEFEARPGKTVQTTLGPGTIEEKDQNYVVVINPTIGTPVRSADRVGRIVSFNDEMIKLSFDHPFGGHVLSCDIAVENAEFAAK